VIEGKPSRTAIGAAEARATHRHRDPYPWIFDDPYALSFAGDDFAALAAESIAAVGETHARRGRAGVATRCRWVEDRLRTAPFAQYVILGAGLDSFAWRRPDLVGPITLFEVDHPSTQAWKRERAAQLALPVRDGHRFVGVDFRTDDVWAALRAAGFEDTRPALFSWIATTMYLPVPAVAATLRALSRCARDTEIAFSYNIAPSCLDDEGRTVLDAMTKRVAEMGEPLQSSFTPDEIESLVAGCGLTVVDHPTTDDLVRRYFADRTDGLRPMMLERMLAARVG
jgi:methyltransferase (TIGR00027 family)